MTADVLVTSCKLLLWVYHAYLRLVGALAGTGALFSRTRPPDEADLAARKLDRHQSISAAGQWRPGSFTYLRNWFKLSVARWASLSETFYPSRMSTILQQDLAELNQPEKTFVMLRGTGSWKIC
jgi:hypothetical protein